MDVVRDHRFTQNEVDLTRVTKGVVDIDDKCNILGIFLLLALLLRDIDSFHAKIRKN